MNHYLYIFICFICFGDEGISNVWWSLSLVIYILHFILVIIFMFICHDTLLCHLFGLISCVLEYSSTKGLLYAIWTLNFLIFLKRSLLFHFSFRTLFSVCVSFWSFLQTHRFRTLVVLSLRFLFSQLKFRVNS